MVYTCAPARLYGKIAESSLSIYGLILILIAVSTVHRCALLWEFHHWVFPKVACFFDGVGQTYG